MVRWTKVKRWDKQSNEVVVKQGDEIEMNLIGKVNERRYERSVSLV